ncbi:hypothetical protein D3C81_1469830 [compost metagenome]
MLEATETTEGLRQGVVDHQAVGGAGTRVDAGAVDHSVIDGQGVVACSQVQHRSTRVQRAGHREGITAIAQVAVGVQGRTGVDVDRVSACVAGDRGSRCARRLHGAVHVQGGGAAHGDGTGVQHAIHVQRARAHRGGADTVARGQRGGAGTDLRKGARTAHGGVEDDRITAIHRQRRGRRIDDHVAGAEIARRVAVADRQVAVVDDGVAGVRVVASQDPSAAAVFGQRGNAGAAVADHAGHGVVTGVGAAQGDGARHVRIR